MFWKSITFLSLFYFVECFDSSTFCSIIKTGKFPDPENCTKYIKCFRGKVIYKTCHHGYKFNCLSRKCALQEFKPCCLKDPSNQESGQGCFHLGIKFPNPVDCTMYFECFNLEIVSQGCPVGTNFDWIKMACVDEPLARCAFNFQQNNHINNDHNITRRTTKKSSTPRSSKTKSSTTKSSTTNSTPSSTQPPTFCAKTTTELSTSESSTSEITPTKSSTTESSTTGSSTTQSSTSTTIVTSPGYNHTDTNTSTTTYPSITTPGHNHTVTTITSSTVSTRPEKTTSISTEKMISTTNKKIN